MKLKLYSVFDSKTACFSAPYTGLSDAAAIRSFADSVNDPNSGNWNRHPEDYSLFFIGEINEDTGHLIPTNPISLVTASALKAVSVPAQRELPFELKNYSNDKSPVN